MEIGTVLVKASGEIKTVTSAIIPESITLFSMI